MTPEQRPHIAGYEVIKTVAHEQLCAGLLAVIDAVNPFDFVRPDSEQMAADFDGPSPVYRHDLFRPGARPSPHRRTTRSGLKEITWGGERQVAYYELFTGHALRLDAGNLFDQNSAAANAYVR